jgi:glycopeptide antibiotics resistance protein
MKWMLIMVMLLSISSEAQTIPQDKMLHLSACYVISSTSTSFLSYKYPKKKAMWIGFGLGVGVGITKEVYDIKFGDADINDLYFDIIGAGLGAVVVTIRF